MADDKFKDKLKGQIPSCLMHFEGVKENLFKISQLRLKKFAECRSKWLKLHCEQAEIAKKSYNIFDDNYLSFQLSKGDNWKFTGLDWHYHKTCYKKFCNEEKICRQQKKELNKGSMDIENVSSRAKVMEPVEPQRKLTRNSDVQLSKAMSQRNKHVLPECCIICGKDSSWFTRDKVRLNPEFVCQCEI